MNLLESVILATLVCAFLTQVAVADAITAPIRSKIHSFKWGWRSTDEENGTILATPRRTVQFIGRIVDCHRCCGVWMSVPATLLVLHRWPWTGQYGLGQFAIVAMSASMLQFLVMRAGDALSMIAEARSVPLTSNRFTTTTDSAAEPVE